MVEAEGIGDEQPTDPVTSKRAQEHAVMGQLKIGYRTDGTRLTDYERTVAAQHGDQIREGLPRLLEERGLVTINAENGRAQEPSDGKYLTTQDLVRIIDENPLPDSVNHNFNKPIHEMGPNTRRLVRRNALIAEDRAKRAAAAAERQKRDEGGPVRRKLRAARDRIRMKKPYITF
jgi:hypothetical protein